MTEKNNPPFLRMFYGNFEFLGWEKTFAGQNYPSKQYTIGLKEFDKETQQSKTTSQISLNKSADVSTVKYLLHKMVVKNPEEPINLDCYSIEYNKEGKNVLLKKHYTDKQGEKKFQPLIIQDETKALQLIDLLTRSLSILIKPAKTSKKEETQSSKTTNENEFVDETGEDDIPF
jgi:hypothetical protein